MSIIDHVIFSTFLLICDILYVLSVFASCSFAKYNYQTKKKKKKGKRKVQGVPQSQTAALPRPQEEEETDKSKQAQTEQTYEKHKDSSLVPKRGNRNAF